MATTDDKPPVFLDTNVLIRFTLATAPLHKEAREAITLLWDNDVELWISRQVIREYAAVLTRPQTYTQPLTSTVVVEQIHTIREQFRVADETADVTTNLLSLMQSVALGGNRFTTPTS